MSCDSCVVVALLHSVRPQFLCLFHPDFSEDLPDDMFKKAKQMGFSDKQLASAVNTSEDIIRQSRYDKGLFPWVKQVRFFEVDVRLVDVSVRFNVIGYRTNDRTSDWFPRLLSCI